jgi:hypothetical protein
MEIRQAFAWLIVSIKYPYGSISTLLAQKIEECAGQCL